MKILKDTIFDLDIYFKNDLNDEVSTFEPLKTIDGSEVTIHEYHYLNCFNGDSRPYFNPNTGDLIGCTNVTAEWARERGYFPVYKVWSNYREGFVYQVGKGFVTKKQL